MRIFKKIPGAWGAIQRHRRLLLPRITVKRLINLALVGVEMMFRCSRLRSRPIVAKIEACCACNLRCLGCRSGSPQVEYPAGNLSVEDFEVILDKMGDYLFEIVFYIWGEPLMNKKLPELIAAAHRRNISVIISTNLHFLTEEMGTRLINCQLDKLVFCIDGWSQEAYEEVRIGGDLDLVKTNIKRFVQQRSDANSTKPYLEWQYVVTTNNRPELPPAREAAQEWGVNRFVELVDWGQRIEDPDYWKGLDKAKKKMRAKINRCFWLWSSVAIQYDGQVFPCCHVARTTDSERVYGNIIGQDLNEVWNSAKYQQARLCLKSERQQCEGDFVCKECYSPPIFIDRPEPKDQ